MNVPRADQLPDIDVEPLLRVRAWVDATGTWHQNPECPQVNGVGGVSERMMTGNTSLMCSACWDTTVRLRMKLAGDHQLYQEHGNINRRTVCAAWRVFTDQWTDIPSACVWWQTSSIDRSVVKNALDWDIKTLNQQEAQRRPTRKNLKRLRNNKNTVLVFETHGWAGAWDVRAAWAVADLHIKLPGRGASLALAVIPESVGEKIKRFNRDGDTVWAGDRQRDKLAVVACGGQVDTNVLTLAGQLLVDRWGNYEFEALETEALKALKTALCAVV